MIIFKLRPFYPTRIEQKAILAAEDEKKTLELEVIKERR